MKMEGYFDWIMPMIADELEMPDELVEQMKEGTFTYEITGENGQLTIKAGGSYGDAFPYDFTGDGVGDAFTWSSPTRFDCLSNRLRRHEIRSKLAQRYLG